MRFNHLYAFLLAVKCAMLAQPEGGVLSPIACGNTDQQFSTICNVTCHIGFSHHDRNNSRKCQSNKVWTHQSEIIKCTRYIKYI